MSEFLTTVVASPIFEGLSLVGTFVGILLAAYAVRIAKQAHRATTESHLAALRLKRQDELLEAERSLKKLQENCFQVRSQWDMHFDKYASLGRENPEKRERTLQIFEVERRGRKLLSDLKAKTLATDTLHPNDVESQIKDAQLVAITIEKLVFELEVPKPSRRL
jgi:hypothetical protein